jgi:hypothetical protein
MRTSSAWRRSLTTARTLCMSLCGGQRHRVRWRTYDEHQGRLCPLHNEVLLLPQQVPYLTVGLRLGGHLSVELRSVAVCATLAQPQ